MQMKPKTQYVIYYSVLLLCALLLLQMIYSQVLCNRAVAKQEANQLKRIARYSQEQVQQQTIQQALNQVRIWLLEHPAFKPASYTQASIWSQLTHLASRLHLRYVVDSAGRGMVQDAPVSQTTTQLQLQLFGGMQQLFAFVQSLITTLSSLKLDSVHLLKDTQKHYKLIIDITYNIKNKERADEAFRTVLH